MLSSSKGFDPSAMEPPQALQQPAARSFIEAVITEWARASPPGSSRSCWDSSSASNGGGGKGAEPNPEAAAR